MNKILLKGLSAVLLALSLVACNISSQPAPTQSLTTITGQTIAMTQVQHYTLVNFWATSCATCVEEMPELIALHHAYQHKGFRLIAIAMSYDRPDYVLNFSRQHALPFPVVLDTTEKHAQSFGGIVGTPTSFLINPEGKIIKRYIGKPDFAELKALLQSKG